MLLPLLVYALAWFFQALTGFGAGILIVGVLALFYEPRSVVISSAFVNLVGILLMLILLRGNRAELGTLFWLSLGSLPGVALSSKLLLLVSQEFLKLAIGLFILSLGFYDLLVQRGILRRRLRRSRLFALIAGFLSGLFAGLVGMGGPPPVVYMNQVCKDVGTLKLTLTLFFGVNILLRVFFYTAWGGAELIRLELILPALIGVPLGVFLGLYVSGMTSATALKRFIALSVFLLGLILTAEGFKEFLGFPLEH
ncbi:MAG: sulfite exporter TauE/SafE family protein [Aquificae bacterium]|nr:sulfite exporter TauE/SafE family protein [Aquificota bacterium]